LIHNESYKEEHAVTALESKTRSKRTWAIICAGSVVAAFGIAMSHGCRTAGAAKGGGVNDEDSEQVDAIEIEAEIVAPYALDSTSQSETQHASEVPGVYIVVHGDTLSQISHRFGLSTKQICSRNNISDANVLSVGQTLDLTDATATGLSAAGGRGLYTVQQGDTLWSIARRMNTSVAALRAANGISGDLIVWKQELVIPKGPGRE
jgi:peptidoglycan endopeptidase LytF